MMKLSYTGDSLLISDGAAHALLEYARVLATTGGSDIVTFPVLDGNNEITEANILIGPASQLILTHAHGDTVIDDKEAIDTMKEKTASLQPRQPVVGDATVPAITDEYGI
jgi:hypothetical protein